MKPSRFLKIVLIGNTKSGKTSLIKSMLQLTQESFKNKPYYKQTIFDNFKTTFLHNHKYKLNFFDTSGSEEFDVLRKLSYPNTDVFVICYHKNDSRALVKWIDEVRDYYAPIVAVCLDNTNQVNCSNFHVAKNFNVNLKNENDIRNTMKGIVDVYVDFEKKLNDIGKKKRSFWSYFPCC